jgi:hypothetical protein
MGVGVKPWDCNFGCFLLNQYLKNQFSVRKEISLSSLKMVFENINLKGAWPSHNPMA